MKKPLLILACLAAGVPLLLAVAWWVVTANPVTVTIVLGFVIVTGAAVGVFFWRTRDLRDPWRGQFTDDAAGKRAEEQRATSDTDQFMKPLFNGGVRTGQRVTEEFRAKGRMLPAIPAAVARKQAETAETAAPAPPAQKPRRREWASAARRCAGARLRSGFARLQSLEAARSRWLEAVASAPQPEQPAPRAGARHAAEPSNVRLVPVAPRAARHRALAPAPAPAAAQPAAEDPWEAARDRIQAMLDDARRQIRELASA